MYKILSANKYLLLYNIFAISRLNKYFFSSKEEILIDEYSREIRM